MLSSLLITLSPRMDAYGRRRPPAAPGPLRRACAPFAAKAAQGWRRQTPAAARGYAPFLGGRAFGPPLCRGSAPATPPSKTSHVAAPACV